MLLWVCNSAGPSRQSPSSYTPRYSPTYPSAPNYGTPSAAPPVASQATPYASSPEPLPDSSARAESKPAVGSGRTLSGPELRYCVFENARLEHMKGMVANNSQIATFNRYVQDYNSRCSNFRYRRGTLEAMQREAAERSSALRAEATLRL